MIYLATGLILIGLFFFIVASLDSKEFTISKKPKEQKKSSKKEEYLFNRKYPIKKYSKEKDDQIASERKVEKTPSKNRNTQVFFTSPMLDEILDEDEVFTQTKIQTPIIQMPTKIMQAKSFKAILFFDYSNQIALYKNKNASQIFPMYLLQQLKRIGLSNIKKENDLIFLESNSGIIEYKLDEIEKMYFFDEAFSFQSNKKFLPTPILFSEDIKELKSSFEMK